MTRRQSVLGLDPGYLDQRLVSPCCYRDMDETDAVCPECKEPCTPEPAEDDSDYDCEFGGDGRDD